MSDQRGSHTVGESTIAIAAALVANALITVTKGIAAVLTGSGGMLAETAHSLADTTNQILLFVGVRRSARPATDEQPFGYGRERYFWVLIVALFLFFGGGVFAIFEAWDRLHNDHAVTDPLIAFVVLGIAFIFEGASLVVAFREALKEARVRAVGVRRFLSEIHDPVLRTVLFEDSAALLGLVIAASGLALTVITNNHLFDAGSSALIGVLLIFVAYQLASDARTLIIGEAPPPDVRAGLLAIVSRAPDVDHVFSVSAMRMGAGELLVAARVSIRDSISAGEAEHVTARLGAQMRDHYPEVTYCFIEIRPYTAPAPPSRRDPPGV